MVWSVQATTEGVWKTQHESEDKQIQALSKTLPFVIESGLAATTNKKNIFVGGKIGLIGVTVNKE